MVRSRVAVVVKGYPRLSETFIAQEIAGLEARGLELLIVSLRWPTDTIRHEVHDRIRAGVLYLPEYLHQEPFRVLAAFGHWFPRPAFWRSLPLWLRDFLRDPTRNRLRRIGQALVLAAELPDDIALLYVHYLHTPASVGRYAARLRKLPLALSAHAKDIWTTSASEKADKINAAEWLVTCTQGNAEHLQSLAPHARVERLYHGIEIDRFDAMAARVEPAASGKQVILTVARAVEKKGLDTLLEALAVLRNDNGWRAVHIGGGVLLDELKAKARALGLEDRIEWRGPQDHGQIAAAMREATIFCLPARVARDGDRDGLPNVLLEALSQRLPVVTTGVSAIGELVDETTGILVSPDRPDELAAALARLMADPDLRRKLGEAGRKRVERDFAFGEGVDRIAALIKETVRRHGGTCE